MNRSLIIGALASVVLAACSNSGTSTLPSSPPTTLPPSASQAICDAQGQILSILSQVQATSLQSKAELAAQLQELQAKLAEQAESLESQGATPLADQVRAASDAVGQLATAVNGTDPAAVVSAVGEVADALSKIPGCPSPSVSPSS
jgi:TolA-binding protein